METTDHGILSDWQRLLDMVVANAADLPYLEAPRIRLGAQLTQALEIQEEKAALTASGQEKAKQLRVIMTEGQRLATAMRMVIKAHYGIRSEKLAEFGLRPFQGRNRKAAQPTQAAPAAIED